MYIFPIIQTSTCGNTENANTTTVIYSTVHLYGWVSFDIFQY